MTQPQQQAQQSQASLAMTTKPSSNSAFEMRPPMDVRFDNISYHVTPRKRRPLLPAKKLEPVQILHDISGHVPAGESLAILGPSGCGKTSLLNILAARSAEPPSSGSITFSGRPRHPRTKRDIGYVMQDDVFLSQLTVRETLDFTADVRLPQSFTPAERAARVDHVIQRLRLAKCQHTRVGTQSFDKGISGGERKRLNIANELLHEPSLLLADECTSGLDSSSAYTVIKFLSELCEEGRTVIVTIHQPSSQMFALFDNIMLLAAGRTAYCGPSAHMVAYFEAIDFPFPAKAYNPADYALELVIDKGGDGGTIEQSKILDAWEQRGASELQSLTQTQPVATTTRRRREASRGARGSHVVLPIDALKGSDTPSSDGGSSSADAGEAEQQPTILPKVSTNAMGRMQRAASKRVADVTGRRGSDGVSDKYPTDWWTQVRALSRRAFRKKQGLMTELPQIIQLLSIVVVLSAVWNGMPASERTIEDRLGALSFVPIFWMVFSALNALHTFPPERTVLSKDRASGTYRLSAYFFSKMMVELPVDTIFPIVATSILYYIVNLNRDVRAFVLHTTVMTLNNLVAQSMGLLVSAVVMDISLAQVTASLWMQLNMLTSGYIVNPSNLPSIFTVFRQVNFLKLTYEGLVQIEMSFGRTIACNTPPLPFTEYSAAGRNCPIAKDDLLRAAQIEGAPSIAEGIVFQILFIVVLRVLAYLALKFLHRQHKPRPSFWRQDKQ